MPLFRSPVVTTGPMGSPALALTQIQGMNMNAGATGGACIGDGAATRRLMVFNGAGTFSYTIDGSNWSSPATATPQGLLPSCVASNSTTTLMGGAPPSNANTKLYFSTDGGANWSGSALGNADTAGVYGVGWGPTVSLWFASMQGLGLYTRSGGGGAWTLRSNVCSANNFMTGRGGLIVALSNRAAPMTGTNYYTSTDGTSWTERTFPQNSYTMGRGCWSPSLGKWFQPSVGGLYSSVDGINWVLADATWASATGDIVDLTGLLVRGDGKCSLDGANWRPFMDALNTTMQVHVSSYGGLLMRDGGDLYVAARLTV